MTQAEIQFPVDWEFRIIVKADAAESARPLLEECFRRHGVDPRFEEGLQSGKGAYRTFKCPSVLTGRAMMDSLAEELAVVNGVKMVL